MGFNLRFGSYEDRIAAAVLKGPGNVVTVPAEGTWLVRDGVVTRGCRNGSWNRMTELLDARGVAIAPGDTVVVVYGSGDTARPFLGTIDARVYGFRGRQVRCTPSGYPYVTLTDVPETEVFARPERILVVKGVPDESA
jgi:hypothetical protein